MGVRRFTIADFLKGEGRRVHKLNTPLDIIEDQYGDIETWHAAMCAEQEIEDAYRAAKTKPEKWAVTRRYYRFIQPAIDAARHDEWANDVYAFPWFDDVTPIEYAAWQCIRGASLVLYPQYPVLQYFIDFASPKKKIALELDGKDWHDPAKDKIRDKALEEIGWTVYRVPGAECLRILPGPGELREKYDYETDSGDYRLEMRAWYCTTVDGVVSAIDRRYFSKGGRRECWRHPDIDFIYETLDKHCTAGRRGA